MLRAGLPRIGGTLQARGHMLRWCGTASPSRTCVHTVSLLDYQPRSPNVPALRHEQRGCCPPGAAFGVSSGRWVLYHPMFSTDSTQQPEPLTKLASSLSVETVSHLRNLRNGADIYVIGTAHISKDSAEEVRRLIRQLQPDAVMIELDEGRAARLRNGKTVSFLDFLKNNLLGIFIPGPHWGSAVIRFGVGSMYQVMRLLGLEPGGEFKAAMEEAKAVGAHIVFGDQPVELTSQRIATQVGLRDVAQVLFARGEKPWYESQQQRRQNGSGSQQRQQQDQRQQRQEAEHRERSGVEQRVEALKTRRAATQVREWLRKASPQLAAVLLDERDQHMVNQLRQLDGKVVAVVGLGHLDGIEAKWRELDRGSC